MSKTRILYIDDEAVNLINFEQAFGREYAIFTALSGERGLDLLQRIGEVAVVVSDQRMPGLSGIDVLEAVREMHPKTVRIILTAYTEVQELLDAINRGYIYKYIVKPWDESEVRILLKHAVETYQLTKRNQELVTELINMNAKLEERVASRVDELHKANKLLRTNNNRLADANMKVQAQARELEQMNDLLAFKVEELEEALSRVRRLQRLLPICSYCKKIRDDQDYWQELESYMRDHADIVFTHSICPHCYEEHVKEELAALRGRKKREED